MGWPPQPGEPLPRADACWHEPIKFEEWILVPRGHGREWQQVFGVGPGDREAIWRALASAARTATIMEVRDREVLGVVCGVREQVTIGERRALVTMSWHYSDPTAAPRLATAYPSP
jgi:hypothetical protein